ncbi:MAG: hypothetical protein ACI4AL_11300 [Aristaeellaceae bacterium]
MDTIILSNVNNKVNAITHRGAYLTTEFAGKISQFQHISSQKTLSVRRAHAQIDFLRHFSQMMHLQFGLGRV